MRLWAMRAWCGRGSKLWRTAANSLPRKKFRLPSLQPQFVKVQDQSARHSIGLIVAYGAVRKPNPATGRLRGIAEAYRGLQGNVAVLLARHRIALVLEHPQGGDQLRTGEARLDDGVNVAALGGDVGIGKALAEIPGFLAPHGVCVLSCLEVAAVDDVHRAFRTHDGDFPPSGRRS